ncbi:MAG: CPBP family intramembrane glutamic endopeptidase [Pseudomonadales bacterium]|nr:CPBP family intramembrane glutamic endopeptidase [Pseudomonadales bacterium]
MMQSKEIPAANDRPCPDKLVIESVRQHNRLSFELVLLFIGIPLSLLLPIAGWIKLLLGLAGVSYCILVGIRQSFFNRRSLFARPVPGSWQPLVFLFFMLALALTGLMYWLDSEKLFIVVRNNVWLWLGISIFYSVFSVFPQELVYRHFFFNRYAGLFGNPRILLLANAAIFAFAHIIFLNALVLALTFVGGILFGLTYQKSRSLLLTSFEHALYGVWIFTLGMGEMLAFPMPG